jgi:hypothetical protein
VDIRDVTIMHTSRVTLLVSLLRGRQSLPLRINLIDCIGCDANRHAGVRFTAVRGPHAITRQSYGEAGRNTPDRSRGRFLRRL